MPELTLKISTAPDGTTHHSLTGAVDLLPRELLGQMVGTMLREANLLRDRLADAIELGGSCNEFAAYLHGLRLASEGVDGVEVVRGQTLQMSFEQR